LKHKVCIARCNNYELENIEKAVRSILEPLGGMKAFVREGNNVLVKPNMLRGAKPEEALTTHPAIVEAVVKMVGECGGKAVIADSPGSGYPYISTVLALSYKKCGFEDVANRHGIKCNTDTSVESVTLDDSLLVKRIDLIKPAIDADVVINLPKAKTHTYTYLTGAVKNLFGLVPGFQKPGFHGKLREPRNFSRMLLDIINFIKPAVSIMDAVVGMEGDGPAMGDPRKIGALIAGVDPTSIDIVISTIMGIDPLDVPTIYAAVDGNLSSGKLGDIEIAGDSVESLKIKDFKVPLTISQGDGFDAILSPFQSIFRGYFTEMFTVKPAIIKKKCVGCGACRNACPEEAITIKNKIAKIDYKKCIRCYCCHEMCPHHAITLKQSFLNRLIRMVSH